MRHTDYEVNSVSGAMAAAEESECNYKLRKERCLCVSTKNTNLHHARNAYNNELLQNIYHRNVKMAKI